MKGNLNRNRWLKAILRQVLPGSFQKSVCCTLEAKKLAVETPSMKDNAIHLAALPSLS